jgi:aryl-alcohol dehydrogenase-like predicted oxidoreductase
MAATSVTFHAPGAGRLPSQGQEATTVERKVSPDTAVISSRIGLGTWSIGGSMWGGTDEADAVKTIRTALELGITLIDTAPVYGFGKAEELVGRALAEHGGRERVVVATKAGLRWRAGAVYRDASPSRIRSEVEDSLRRLKTDYIDIYQVHWPDPLVPMERTAAALRALYEHGTIHAIGVSNFSPPQIETFRAVAPLHVIQSPYNLFERGIENDILPYAERHGLAVFAYGALCRGLLSGRMRRDTKFTGDDIRQSDPKFQPRRYGQYLAAVAALDRLALDRYGRTVLALAVRWILDQGVSVALWGARKPEQLAPVGEVLGWRLGADAREAIDRVLRETITDPVGPDFMAPPARSGQA